MPILLAHEAATPTRDDGPILGREWALLVRDQPVERAEVNKSGGVHDAVTGTGCHDSLDGSGHSPRWACLDGQRGG